ncbi:MAG: glycogen synthase GlgA [Clostridia bacterium]|nr:glycogen synthase GlgA [Clostridia bacterium]
MAVKKTTETKAKTTKSKVSVEIVPKKSILFVASEANPFAGTGGLADVIGSLPKALAKNANFDVRVAIPLYASVDYAWRERFTFVGNFNVPLAWRNQYCGVYSYKYEGVTFYFIDNEYYFKRKGLYGHGDDGERFAFFSKAVLEMMRYLDYYPDLMHSHDWQSALSIIYLKTLYQGQYGYDNVRAVFTIHNIEYQGKFGFDVLGDVFGLPEEARSIVEYAGCVNLMKGAIQVAEKFSTVSRTYASEIKDAFFAHGLQDIIAENEFKMTGILNGIDQDVYSASKDTKLFANYTATKPENKSICKAELQKMLNLPEREDVPVISIITRLVSQKGLDLIKAVFEDILSEDVQIVILGTGDSEYEDYFKFIASRYEAKCRTIIAYNKDLASKIYSGSDIFLMPSKHEPCGLSQMIACKYGTVPVVRATGGLADSIDAFNDGERKTGNGFKFYTYNAHEMLYVVKDAIFTFGDKKQWVKLIKNAMKTDFSWKRSALEYENLYNDILM